MFILFFLIISNQALSVKNETMLSFHTSKKSTAYLNSRGRILTAVQFFFPDLALFLLRCRYHSVRRFYPSGPLTAPGGSASHFLLPIRAISSALAAALVLMSWFLARSMRTLRMLVGTSRDRAKRDPCWTLTGTCEAGRGALAGRSTVWCLDRSSDFSRADFGFSTLKPSTSL